MIKHSAKIYALFEALLLGLTFVDLVDFGMRIICGILAAIVSIMAYRHYKLKNRLVEKQIAEQTLKNKILQLKIDQHESEG